MGLTCGFAGLTRNNDRDNAKRTSLLVLESTYTAPAPPPPDDFRALAVVTAYNEADVLGSTIEYLLDDGVDVHVVDNWSDDGTWELTQRYLDRPGFTAERHPEAPSTTYDWVSLLVRVEQIAAETTADWCIHHDADERRRSPWPGVSLREGLWRVQHAGFDAVDHTVVDFRPVDDTFRPGDDCEVALRHFELGRRPGHFQQVKAWRRTGRRVMLAETGGHSATFAGRRVFPYNFLLKHYPIRSQAHGEQKVLRERIARWNPDERAMGWHYQYDGVDEGHSFLADPAALGAWDDDTFHRDLLTERLGRVW
jgi:hypothetical protein